MCNLQGLRLGRSSSSLIGVPQQPCTECIGDCDADDAAGSKEIMIRAAAAGEPSSARLWAMVNDFLEEVSRTPPPPCTLCRDDIQHGTGSMSEGSFLTSSAANLSGAILKRAIQEMESMFTESSGRSVTEGKVASSVAKALIIEKTCGTESSAHNMNEQALPRVLKYLQMEGFDVGLCCTTAQKSSNGTLQSFPPAGGHRYIDVIMEEMLVSAEANAGKKSSDQSRRLIVDVGFRVHFEIARPLPAYQKLLSMLPSTFVGKALLLQKVVRIMSQAARASLESQDMPIPPWRSFSFLLAKWISPSCARVTSFEEAKHIVLNTSSSTSKHGDEPGVLAELVYNADSAATLAHANDSRHERTSSCLPAELTAKAPWYPPPTTNRIPSRNSESDGSTSGYSKKRRQANVVSALALAFSESRRTQVVTECVAASAAGKVMC